MTYAVSGGALNSTQTKLKPKLCICVSACLFICLSVRQHIYGITRPFFTNFVHGTSGGFAILYVLPDL